MKWSKKTKENISMYLIYLAVVAVILAAFGAARMDIWLASTQWLLVAAVLILFGIFLRIG